jgi:hypothetical protein
VVRERPFLCLPKEKIGYGPYLNNYMTPEGKALKEDYCDL